ncbi:hypothetical protein P171DRAFT_444861 [Karstenula rhodostoma CBS 690.94]|uniref:Uncharacterized protein n=1 Tax=Karstenula rhodostoma CBS 690.94 TaxID=1392251 RepID=A0A9P4PGE2_9PLEO|nr:hypothetical protein P171DRAFT_444861 [Karstenula rhodostoma CBS 690.94]
MDTDASALLARQAGHEVTPGSTRKTAQSAANIRPCYGFGLAPWTAARARLKARTWAAWAASWVRINRHAAANTRPFPSRRYGRRQEHVQRDAEQHAPGKPIRGENIPSSATAENERICSSLATLRGCERGCQSHENSWPAAGAPMPPRTPAAGTIRLPLQSNRVGVVEEHNTKSKFPELASCVRSEAQPMVSAHTSKWAIVALPLFVPQIRLRKTQ